MKPYIQKTDLSDIYLSLQVSGVWLYCVGFVVIQKVQSKETFSIFLIFRPEPT